MQKTIVAAVACLLALSACKNDKPANTPTDQPAPQMTKPVSISKTGWGTLPDGTPLDLYTLKNGNGMQLTITNYGGIITSWTAPDRKGNYADVVLGYDSIGGYLKETPYFGALIGRYGNRIAKGRFSLDGQTYTLAVNNIGNHLHGGLKGFDKVVWQGEVLPTPDSIASLKLTYRSKDLEEGYPGNLDVTVVYTLDQNNALHIRYEATTDKPTVVNLTQHSYFNLTGNQRDILDHQLTLHADRFLPVDKTLIPTGELKPVKGTVFDFTTPHAIGERINEKADQQIEYGGGYDHAWVLNRGGAGLSLAASALEPTTGRYLEVLTTEPAIQFYSGNFLDGKITGKNGVVYQHRYGFCLETEHYPDSPNQPAFPSTVLRPGETYRTETVYRFSTK
jgi:aldose 1-epimerase